MTKTEDQRFPFDTFGIAFVATLRGTPGRDIVDAALAALLDLDPRDDAQGVDGNGAGILTQVPDAFLRDVVDADLPAPGHYAIGLCFLPTEHAAQQAAMAGVAAIAAAEGLDVLAWRSVPVTTAAAGPTALATMPALKHLVLASRDRSLHGIDLERRAYRVRKRAEHAHEVYLASLSCRTLVYKGLLSAQQLESFFPDLSDPRLATEIALVHSRFSSVTAASWQLAHPFRLVANDGEIRTARGNRGWMSGRQSLLASDVLGDVQDLLPICDETQSGSASFDEVLELLHLGGRSLPHAVLMMMPEAWENHPTMSHERRAFYEYSATIMEPWDGPAAMCFTDGRYIGALADRNGSRGARFWITEDGLVVLASESGVLDIPPERVARKGRLDPGRMLLVDTGVGRVLEDSEIKSELAAALPYRRMLTDNLVRVEQLPDGEPTPPTQTSLAQRQQAVGCTPAEQRSLLQPMALAGASALATIDGDAAYEALASRPRLLFDRFVPWHAPLTSPPLDLGCEDLLPSLGGAIGPEANLLVDGETQARKVLIGSPVIDEAQLAAIRADDRTGDVVTVTGRYRVDGGAAALEKRLAEITAEVDRAIEQGAGLVVLSDRGSDDALAPIPSLLLTAAVHQHTVRSGTRARISVLVESGDAREPEHVALLIGYGAACVVPYLALETVQELARSGAVPGTAPAEAARNFLEALAQGVLETMSRAGVSTLAAYRGAQAFQTVGLDPRLVERYFAGTPAVLGGVGLDVLASEIAARHAGAGIEPTREGQPALRDLLALAVGRREAVPIGEVEPVEEILTRFSSSETDGLTVRVSPDRSGVTAARLSGAAGLEITSGSGVSRHHDVDSVDDLAQLVEDLRNAGPQARVHLVLPSHVDVGSIAAGMARARPDVLVIAAREHGASDPLTSLRRVGNPWELGLAATHQSLVRAGLRDQVSIKVDGVLETSRDVMIATLLGADEVALSTAPPEPVAQQVREHLARLGLRSVAEAVGALHLLAVDEAIERWGAAGIDIAPVLEKADPPSLPVAAPTLTPSVDGELERSLVARAEPALERREQVRIVDRVRVRHRGVGARLGHEVVRRLGGDGLPAGTIEITLTGSAGSSFGAFLPGGVTLRLHGDANDHVGKGLSGGCVAVRPERTAVLSPSQNVIAGNAVGYGATAGAIYLRGIAGERFAVCSAGATLVAEGVGDHACERMTGGIALVLGPTGRGLGAGMRGGVAYVLDLVPALVDRAARERGDLALEEVDDADTETIVRLLTEHHRETDSRVALMLLEDSDGIGRRFTRLRPRSGVSHERTYRA